MCDEAERLCGACLDAAIAYRNCEKAELISLIPESGVKIAISELDRLQSVNLAQDAIGQIL